eukprot:TRINITY_DN102950_c0_g1_i1.p1 TRINITY_DN102950_c0_g1~~TRINITY_DN102950_c0_g1_i1.p1  ORF type:complete len:112 (-),score=5.13 TRINITY_DN102950_c0_g1_i1:400-735(-)
MCNSPPRVMTSEARIVHSASRDSCRCGRISQNTIHEYACSRSTADYALMSSMKYRLHLENASFVRMFMTAPVADRQREGDLMNEQAPAIMRATCAEYITGSWRLRTCRWLS